MEITMAGIEGRINTKTSIKMSGVSGGTKRSGYGDIARFSEGGENA